MLYAVVFCAASLSALVLLHVLPSPGSALLKARLGALDAAGPGLVPVERAQRVIERRRQRARHQQLQQRLRRLAALGAICMTMLGLFGLASRVWGLLSALVGAVLLLVGVSGGTLFLRHWRGRRVAFQLPVAVRMLADRLQESNSLDLALEYVAKQGPRAAARELGRVRKAIRKGATEERAFGLLARRNPSAEVEMLVSCLSVPHERGQRLAESLRPLQALIESRVQLAKLQARRMRLVSWGLFIPVSTAMVYAGTAGSLSILAAWSCFAIGTLLIAWVSSVKGGLA
ncbi:MAG TPA: type II secretion system F family protein [Stenomitos sp.]